MHTQAGWRGPHEVVELLYDPSRTTLAELLRRAQGIRRFSKAWFSDADDLAAAKKMIGDKAVAAKGMVRRAKDSDQLYYLRHSLLTGLHLQGAQAIRANALLAQKKDARVVLSPAQKHRLQELSKANSPKERAGNTRRSVGSRPTRGDR